MPIAIRAVRTKNRKIERAPRHEQGGITRPRELPLNNGGRLIAGGRRLRNIDVRDAHAAPSGDRVNDVVLSAIAGRGRWPARIELAGI